MNEAFFKLHSGLPREAPGDRVSLDWACAMGGVARDARILDAGKGPGGDIAGLLSHAPDGHVTAIEAHQGYVDEIARRFAGDARVAPVLGDMADPGGPYDFIWSAGAIYFLGVTEGLTAWRAALAPGGAVAFSELVWLVDAPEAGLKTTWEAEYPQIGGLDRLKARIEAADYGVLGLRVLADSAWEAYFVPLEARAEALEADADADMVAAIAETRAEIALWRAHRDQFGYALAVVRP